MSIQIIVDRAQTIEIDRRKVSAQTMSRSQRIKSAARASAQPWRFVVTPPGSMKYSDSRGIVEVIDFNDRVTESEINLSKASYITAYRGELTVGQLAPLTISTSSTQTFTLNNLPSVGSSTIMFKSGDYIQPATSRYPYTVVQDVLRGSGSTVSIPLNRPVITSEGITLTGQTLRVGTGVTWIVVVTGLPTYSIVPYNRISYNGNFELVEKII